MKRVSILFSLMAISAGLWGRTLEDFNDDLRIGWSVAIAQVLYRTWGLIVGAPDAHDTSGNLTGGTVTTWSYSE